MTQLTPARVAMALAATLLFSACSDARPVPAAPPRTDDAYQPLVLRDTTVRGAVRVPATAAPWQHATISTKLMGAVRVVHAHVGDRVAAGAPVVTLDVRELDARASQADAGLRAAEASQAEAQLTVDRWRSLVAQEAAPRAQLDAAEAALARAEGAVRTARGANSEVAAVRSYGLLRAPFAGIVVARYVDPGALAAPGAPLLMLIDDHALRLSALVSPTFARTLSVGSRVSAEIEGIVVAATIDGIAPAPTGGTWTITARVANSARSLATGGAATLLLPTGDVTGLLIPATALVRDGELTGVQVPTAAGAERRWVRLGRTIDTQVEILGGLRSGDTILVRRIAGDRS